MKRPITKQHRRLLWVLAVSAGASAPDVAVAQAARSAESALIREGRALLVAGRPEEALARFRVAYELGRSNTALAHMGVAHGALGRFLDAEDCLRRALDAPPDALMEREWIARFQENLRLAQRRVGVLEIDASVVGAVITANGQRIGETPLRGLVRLATGRVVLTASAAGRPTIEREVVLTGGAEAVREQFVFAAPTPQRSVTPVAAAAVAQAPVVVRPARPPAPPRSGPWVVLAVSSAVVTASGVAAGAAGLGVANYNAAQYREGECGMPDDVSECGRALALGSAATVTSAVGWTLATLGAIGTIVFARSSRSTPRPSASRAWVLPALNGAVVVGQF
jgi:tetratricopeptide (TPR) repeat protein